ncbi:MAG: hypothetical protein ABIQ89_00930 [Candidatus Saccharimonadales bacterium]
MFKFIKNTFKKVPKKVAVSIAVLGAVFVPATIALAGFGPGRPTYDYNKYDASKSCTDPSQAYGRCGSLDGPVFNSFVNTPTYGDERNFTRIAEVVAGQAPTDADFRETSTAVPGKSYWVRTFVHNNANQTTNGVNMDGPGIAKNTRVRVILPTGVANGMDLESDITADNAKPGRVWDTATLANGSQAFSVNYVPGSATIYNGIHTAGMPISDAIVSADGTPLGYNAMNGSLPGCFDYSAYVYVKVEVKAPQLAVNKVARVSGTTEYQDKITAKKSDKIQWNIEFKNGGNDVAKDVTIRDTLPNGVTLVPGSIKWTDANRKDEVLPDNSLNQGGINLGNYAPAVRRNGAVSFETTINSDFKGCELKNVAYGRASNIPETSDDSTVTIEDCNPVVPVYSCDMLDAKSLGNRNFQYTLKYTAKNATLKNVSYNFGDDTAPLLTNKTVVEHQYAKDGNYTTKAVLTFTVNGKDVVVNDAKCATTVSSTTPPEHCPIPGKENLPKDSPECKVTPITPAKTILPDTGPGDIAAIFAAVSLAGTMAYRVLMTRRLNG